MLTNFVEVNVKIPRNLYEEIEKRAKIVGTNVQIYIRTLLERHINKIKSKYHDIEIKEVDLVIKLRSIIKKIKTMVKEEGLGTKLSKVCEEDLAHVIKDVVDQIEQKITKICTDKSVNKCDSYIRLKELKSKLLRVENVVERMKIIISEYEDDVIPYIKKLFYMERCSLAELTVILPYTIDKSITKLLIAILEVDV